jgi:cytochrome d ubiquinol oxidase subunit II
VALHPWVLPGATRLTDAAAPPVIAGPVLVVLLVGLAVVAPGYLCMIRVLRAVPE